jgi:hypothetical protein
MSILSIVETIEGDIVAEAKAIIGRLEGIVVALPQQVIVAATQTNLGGTVSNLMSDIQNHAISGAQKFAEVVAAVTKVAGEFLVNGGWAGVFAAVEHFVAGIIQLLYPAIVKAFAPKAA